MTALQNGWFQRKISDAAFRQQWEQEQERRITVGVNAFVTSEQDADQIPLLRVGEEAAIAQRQRLAHLRAARDDSGAAAALAHLREVAATERNVFPAILDAARAYCTLYEIRAAMESVFGAYREPVFF